MSDRTYFDDADPGAIVRDYPVGEAFLAGPARFSAEALRALQEARFRRVVARAWEVPFYRRRWRAAGLAPGDVRGLDDLERIPPFEKSDLMASIEAHPPLGDFHGIDPAAPPHVVVHTTSGTTGAPQPVLYGARDREIQNALLARAYRLHGLRDDDVVHSVYGFGLVNGGHYVRETILHFTRALLLPAGTGLETRSEQQVEIMRRFRATVLVGFADYMARLAEVARARGLEPGRDIRLRMISGHVPRAQRDALSRAWGGAPVHDWYGVGDTGILAAGEPGGDALVLFEDAHVVEILDPASGRACAPGTPGNVCVTVLFKDGVYPIVRFNTNDVTTEVAGRGALAPAFRRIAGFQGRSDNMVKLRGVNVFPTAIGALLAAFPEAGGEYVCRVRRTQGRDEMTALVEWTGARDAGAADALRAHLRERLGVAIEVALVAPGETAPLTGIEQRQKPVRLVDER